MYSDVKSVSETMTMLMRSTGIYVRDRILSKRLKRVYADTMNRCIAAVEANPSNYSKFEASIQSVRDSIDLQFKPRFFNRFSQERMYFNMACDHAFNIISKLNIRFNVGVSFSEPRNYREMEEL